MGESQNLDVSTDKLLTVSSLDDSNQNNTAISTKSSFEQDTTLNVKDSSVEDENVEKLKIEEIKEEYLTWIKKTRKKINKIWTMYKKQSTMELRQEINNLSERIHERIDEFS